MKAYWRFFATGLLTLASAGGTSPRQASAIDKYPPGDVVVHVEKGFAAEQAGLRVDDTILAIDGVPIRFSSQIAIVRDKALLNGEKAVSMIVRRGGGTVTLTITVAEHFGVVGMAPLSSDGRKVFDAAHALPPEQQATALEKMKGAAVLAESGGDLRAAASLWHVCASSSDKPEEEAASLLEQQRCAELAGDMVDSAEAANRLGDLSFSQQKLEDAEKYYKAALNVLATSAPDSTFLIDCLNNLGNVVYQLGTRNYVGARLLAESERYFQQALAIRAKLSPGSLAVAASYKALAVVAFSRSNLAESQNYYLRTLAILELLERNSAELAAIYDSLGSVAGRRDTLEDAQMYYGKAISIWEKLTPDSADMAASCHNMGAIADRRGNLDEAENYYGKALAIREKIAQNPKDVTDSLIGLGNVALQRGKPQKALESYIQSLELMRKFKDRSGEAAILSEIGQIYDMLGRPQQALDRFRVAQAILRKSKNPTVSLHLIPRIEHVHSIMDDSEKQDIPELQTLAASSDNPASRAAAYFQLAQDVRLTDEFTGAECLRQAIKLNPTRIDYVYTFASLITLSGAQFGEAIEMLTSKLAQFPAPNDQSKLRGYLSRIQSRWADDLEEHGRLSEAIEHRQAVYEIDRKYNVKIGSSRLLNAGVLLHYLKQYARAIGWYERSTEIHKELKEPSSVVYDMCAIGDTYTTLKQIPTAIERYEQARSYAGENKDQWGEATANYYLGKTYASLAQYPKAIVCYEQALLVYRERQNSKKEGVTLCALGRIYEKLGKSEQALPLYEQAQPMLHPVGNAFDDNSKDELAALIRIIAIYDQRKQPEKAMAACALALPLFLETGRCADGIAVMKSRLPSVSTMANKDMAIALADLYFDKRKCARLNANTVRRSFSAIQPIHSMRGTGERTLRLI